MRPAPGLREPPQSAPLPRVQNPDVRQQLFFLTIRPQGLQQGAWQLLLCARTAGSCHNPYVWLHMQCACQACGPCRACWDCSGITQEVSACGAPVARSNAVPCAGHTMHLPSTCSKQDRALVAYTCEAACACLHKARGPYEASAAHLALQQRRLADQRHVQVRALVRYRVHLHRGAPELGHGTLRLDISFTHTLLLKHGRPATLGSISNSAEQSGLPKWEVYDTRSTARLLTWPSASATSTFLPFTSTTCATKQVYSQRLRGGCE